MDEPEAKRKRKKKEEEKIEIYIYDYIYKFGRGRTGVGRTLDAYQVECIPGTRFSAFDGSKYIWDTSRLRTGIYIIYIMYIY